MLTDNEKRWLRDRKSSPTPYCGWCMKYALCCSPRFAKCPTDYTSADDFDARVAAKLADPFFPPMDKGSTSEFGHFVMPPMDRLKWARIEVEEEMDDD